MTNEELEIPLGAKDSELLEFSFEIPEDCYMIIDRNKVYFRKRKDIKREMGEEAEEADGDPDKELKEKRLIDCGLSVRAMNCLKSVGIETVYDLCQVNKTSLLKIRNFGKKTLSERDDFLWSIGKTWGRKYLIPVYTTSEHGFSYISSYRFSDNPAI